MEMINFVPGVKDNDSGTVTLMVDYVELKLLHSALKHFELLLNSPLKNQFKSDLSSIIKYVDENYKF